MFASAFLFFFCTCSYHLLGKRRKTNTWPLTFADVQAMKFRQGYLISTGEPKRHYISEAVRHVQMRQGTIGIKVSRQHSFAMLCQGM